MNISGAHFRKNLLLTTLLVMAGFTVFGQNYLQKPVKLQPTGEKLGEVLRDIGEQGGFYFSYSSGIIPSDSLITLQPYKGDVKGALQILLGDGYEYQQSPNHLIIRPAPFKLTLMPEEIGEGRKVYTIRGFVIDEKTGKGIQNASVYEKRLLVGTMTDRKGHFKLKLKSKDSRPVTITVSKELYKDTTTVFLPTVELGKNEGKSRNYGYMGGEGENVSGTAFARLFLSSKQKLNALNLGNFFAYTPVQVSLTPGLSSHGMMSGQVVNKFSYNLLGGYSAGVDGVELAGLFNIDRYDVRYIQLAGLINMVGGTMAGIQLAGIHNTVLDSLRGIQAAGIFNLVRKQVDGLQLAGIANASDSLNGMQTAGIYNHNKGVVKGMQLAGIANYAQEVRGAQMSGLVNKTKINSGFQLALINMADSSTGLSLGIVNLIGNGIKRFSISTNEVFYANLSFRSGTPKFYSIITANFGTWHREQVFGLGFGFGHEFKSAKRKNYFAAELLSQEILSSDFDENNSWIKANVLYNYAISKKTKLYIGPSINFRNLTFTENSKVPLAIPSNNYPFLVDNTSSKLWVGLELGISFF